MPATKSKRRSTKAAKKPVNLEGDFPRHDMVPIHELLSAEEGNRVLERFRTPPDRMPKILRDDPGLLTDPSYRAALEAKEEVSGRLVRVRRKSPTSGEAISYRVIQSESAD